MVENVAPTQTWEALQADANAQLVDVRTDAEWNFVGVPALASAGKQTILIPWQVYPAMQPHPDFVGALRQAGLTPEHRILFLCRSGARSMAAANAAQAAGLQKFWCKRGTTGPGICLHQLVRLAYARNRLARNVTSAQ